MTRALRPLLLALLLLAGSGCGPAYGPEYLLALRAGQRAYHAGRYEAAAGDFARAAGAATRIKDRDEARLLQARMNEKLDRFDHAAAIYRQMVEDSPEGPRRVRAIFELCYLDIRNGAEAGWQALREAVLRYPNHGAARRALALSVQHLARTGGESAARAFLRTSLPRLAGTEAEQQAEYELARSLERGGQLAPAHDALVATARAHPYPFGSLSDDALWRASRIDETTGRYQHAIEDLRELLRSRETAAGGSYERPRFAPAQMRIAKLYRDRLRDAATARAELRKVYTEHANSNLADDAMWQEAVLWHEVGEAAQACALLDRLRRERPSSRYVRCGQLLCPGYTPPAGLRPCPRYIAEPEPEPEREREEGGGEDQP